MRQRLRQLLTGKTCSHPGLAYTTYAPVAEHGEDRGKVDRDSIEAWLGELSRSRPCADFYPLAYERWAATLASCPRQEVESVSPLLVGAGLVSATDVGLQVHRTYGVPYLPGSSLKGLLCHYLDATYGPDQPREEPSTAARDPARVRFQAPKIESGRVLWGAGELYGWLFGQPEADGGLQSASRGHLVFCDALPVPPRRPEDARWFTPEVLTVHQRKYYSTGGAQAPCDYDQPNPVSFLTVAPKVKFLLAIEGPIEPAKWALARLVEALAAWGLGAKASSGYGRFRAGREARVVVRSSHGEDLEKLLRGLGGPSKPTHEDVIDLLATQLLPKLRSIAPGSGDERGLLVRRVQSWIANQSGASKNARAKVNAWLDGELAKIWPVGGG